MNKIILKSLISLSLLPISLPALSEPTTTTEYKFYDIYPQAKSDLGQEMYERSPIIDNGKKYHGYTRWDVNWEFRWKKRNGNCRINTVDTKLAVKYTMPRIPQQHRVNSAVRHSFDQYYAALFKHEEGHKDSGLYAAREIEQELQSLGSFKSCQKLETVANQKAGQVIKKYNDRDINYDRETQHGSLQGANINNFTR